MPTPKITTTRNSTSAAAQARSRAGSPACRTPIRIFIMLPGSMARAKSSRRVRSRRRVLATARCSPGCDRSARSFASGSNRPGRYGAGLTRHLAVAGSRRWRAPGQIRVAPRTTTTLSARSRRPRPPCAVRRRWPRTAQARSTHCGRRGPRARRRSSADAAATAQHARRRPGRGSRPAAHLSSCGLLRICAARRPDPVAFRDPVITTKIGRKLLARRLLNLGRRSSRQSPPQAHRARDVPAGTAPLPSSH